MTGNGMSVVARVARLGVGFIACLTAACGGGSPPSVLRTAKVVLQDVAIDKTLVYESQNLGLIQGMFQPSGSDHIAVFGYAGNCLLTLSGSTAACENMPPGVVPPVSIGTFVAKQYIDADFDGDRTAERVRPIEKAGFTLGKIQGGELARTQLERFWVGSDFHYWFEPAVTWSRPRMLLISTDGTLLLFDNQLKEVRQLPAPGMQSPLHISAGAPLDIAGAGPFASLFAGRGGWHRSILFIHSADNKVVYEEILGDDFQAVWPQQAKDGTYRFLLGGRGQVWEYSFRLPGV